MDDRKRFCQVVSLKPINPISLKQAVIVGESSAIYGVCIYEHWVYCGAPCYRQFLYAYTVFTGQSCDFYLF